MDLGLSAKTVFVTGASGGIGQSIARQFHAEGSQLIVHYRSQKSVAELLVQRLGPDRSLAVGADLTNEAEVDRAFAEAADRFGSIDILVANAGIWPPEDVPLHEMSVGQWQSTLDTNLNSVFLCCRRFIQQVVDHRINDPAIVMIGSTAGLFGEAGHADYAASKSALIEGLNRSLKNEIARVADRGRVNVVCPGWVVTPMAEKFTEDGASLKRALSTIALRKVAGPDDIANAVLFLASSRVAGHITGQVLTVSGGMEGRQLYREDELDVGRAMPK